jgi:hypothetical protein
MEDAFYFAGINLTTAKDMRHETAVISTNHQQP